MQYYISEKPLKLREYGRNVQSMIDYAKTLEDREQRTLVAKEIIRIMTNLVPNLKDNPDYKQKLWDHLFMISEYDFDIDSPYPIPTKQELESRPEKRMEYFKEKPRFKQYGYNVELMIKKAAKMEPGPQRMAYLNLIANTMKLFLRSMDREAMPGTIIAEHMKDISNGAIDIKGEDLTITKMPPNMTSPHNHQSKSSYGRNNKRNNRNNKKSNNKNKNNNRRRKYNNY